MTSNANITKKMTLAELMFARKIRSILEELRSGNNKKIRKSPHHLKYSLKALRPEKNCQEEKYSTPCLYDVHFRR